MTKERKNTAAIQADRITDFLVEDILNASDEEIMAEAKEDYADVKAEAEHIHKLIKSAIFDHGKTQLKEAKKQFIADKEKRNKNVSVISLEDKRALIRRLSESNTGLTLAAREENKMSDRDLDACIQSAYELGLIDEEGNILCNDD